MDTCYNSTILDLTDSINRFNLKLPGAGALYLKEVTDGYAIARNVYYGKQFRQCLGTLAGQTLDICKS